MKAVVSAGVGGGYKRHKQIIWTTSWLIEDEATTVCVFMKTTSAVTRSHNIQRRAVCDKKKARLTREEVV